MMSLVSRTQKWQSSPLPSGRQNKYIRTLDGTFENTNYTALNQNNSPSDPDSSQDFESDNTTCYSSDGSQQNADEEEVDAVRVPLPPVIHHEPEIADTIVREQTGGKVFDDEEAHEKYKEAISEVGWHPEFDTENPLDPWKHRGEIWLTKLLFQSGNISQRTVDKFLRGFADGTIMMTDGDVQFTNSEEMLKLLDIAAGKGVVCPNMLLVCTF